MRALAVGLLAVTLAMGSAVRADAALIVTPGVSNTGTDNVISNACVGTITGPAMTVQGCLNSDHNQFVNFTSDENLVITGGQAVLDAADGSFNNLSIAFADGSLYDKLVLNIDSFENGTVTFTGNPGGGSVSAPLDGTGQNFFTLTGQQFSSISFVTSTGIAHIELVADLKQVRIGCGETNTCPPPPCTTACEPRNVPEPASMTLTSPGLFGLAYQLRRRRAA